MMAATSVLTNGLIGITAVMFTYFISKHWGLLRSIIKTLPRDIMGMYSIISVQKGCKAHAKKNDTVAKIFDQTVAKHPDKVCFYFEGEQWTFRDVQEYSNRIANYFFEIGYRKGDFMALFMSNRPEYLGTWLGLSRIGVITSLLNTNLRQESLKHALEVLPHKGVIFEDDIGREAIAQVISIGYKPGDLYCSKLTSKLLDKSIDLDAELKRESISIGSLSLPDQINFDDPMLCIFTSGTEGLPKAAVVKQSRFFMASMLIAHLFGVKPSDIVYVPLPLYHSVGGLLGLSANVFLGTSVVLRKKFSAASFWEECIRHNVTVSQYIGETLRYLYNQPPSKCDRGHQVRMLFGLGLRKGFWTDFVTRFGITDIREMYASTEGNCTMVNFVGKAGSCGSMPRWASPLLPNKLVRVSEDGEIMRDSKTGHVMLCDIGEPGEMIGKIIRSNPFRDFQGYADKEASQKKIIRDVFCKGDEYFRSGDMLVMDEEGYFYFSDRCGDTFRWKGENVSTQEVEFVISKICDLADVAVYGVDVPGTEGKAGMAALVDPENKVDLKQFSREISQKLPSYARPLFLRIKKSLEFTGTHKIKKTDLQREGFNIQMIKDPIYFFTENEYVLLTTDMHDAIKANKLRI